MKNTFSIALLIWSLTLWSGEILAWEKDKNAEAPEKSTDTTLTVTREKVSAIFNTNLWADTPEEERQKIKALFQKEMGYKLTEEEIEKFTILLQKKDIQDGLYSILKENKTWATGSLILALLLWIGYGYAYRVQIMGQLKEKKRVNARSFATFWAISGMMTLLNGMVPGSVVYFESFLLAFLSVGIDRHNEKHGKSPENGLFEKFANNIPLPVVRYNKEGFPLIWNKQMEDETGYTHAEVAEYYKKNGDVMTLLYKWENLEKVRQYLKQIKESWEGYTNIAFTMTTASWEEKTFLWTTFPDGTGGTMRIAKHLTDIKEIRRELGKTEELMRELEKTKEKLSKVEESTRIDPLTSAYSLKAYNDDIRAVLMEYKERNIVIAFIDLDDFKVFNDKFWHDAGNIVLQKFTQFVQSNLHRKDDRLYRVGWDEFIILIESDDFDGVISKFNRLRNELSKELISSDGKEIPFSIKSSWGITKFVSGQWFWEKSIDNIKKSLMSEADKNMYAVKQYKKYIGERLLSQWKINTEYREKNGVAYKTYWEDGEMIGLTIHNDHGNFSITPEEYEIIEATRTVDDDVGKRL